MVFRLVGNFPHATKAKNQQERLRTSTNREEVDEKVSTDVPIASSFPVTGGRLAPRRGSRHSPVLECT